MFLGDLSVFEKLNGTLQYLLCLEFIFPYLLKIPLSSTLSMNSRITIISSLLNLELPPQVYQLQGLYFSIFAQGVGHFDNANTVGSMLGAME